MVVAGMRIEKNSSITLFAGHRRRQESRQGLRQRQAAGLPAPVAHDQPQRSQRPSPGLEPQRERQDVGNLRGRQKHPDLVSVL